MADDEIMISFDVVSLFTSIDLEFEQNIMDELLQARPPSGHPITSEGIRKLLKLCLITHFRFDGQLYKQIRGTPMGSPISGLLAEVVMQHLERNVLHLIEPKLWMRYVDDTLVIIKKSKVEMA